jgi:alkylation response protein AidB-like acyl-CoA dehydrogenase
MCPTFPVQCTKCATAPGAATGAESNDGMFSSRTADVSEIRSPRDARFWLEETFDATLTLRAWWSLLAEVGLSQPHWPIAHGGLGWGAEEIVEVSRYFAEVGAVGAPTGLGTLMGGPVVLTFGSDEQKQRLLPPLANGTEGWCQLFSEPGAGSDLASLSTKAERDGDEWIISGQKVWTSGAGDSARGMLVARTDRDAPKHRGMTYFIIEMRQPGIEIRPIKQMNGRSHFSEVFLNDARAADANRISAVNDGWAVTTATLGFERSGLSAPDGVPGLRPPAGAFAGYLDKTINELLSGGTGSVAGQRRKVDPPDETGGFASTLREVSRSTGADRNPVARQHLVSVEATERMASYTAQRMAAALANGEAPGPGASLAKLAWTEGLGRARDAGTLVLGAYGMLVDDGRGPEVAIDGENSHCATELPPGGPLEEEVVQDSFLGEGTIQDSFLGDGTIQQSFLGEGTIQHFALTIPSARIAGGSDEVQRNIIGERVLGLPRDPHSDSQIPFRDLLRS